MRFPRGEPSRQTMPNGCKTGSQTLRSQLGKPWALCEPCEGLQATPVSSHGFCLGSFQRRPLTPFGSPQARPKIVDTLRLPRA